jgi:hypothetical protein
MPVLLVQQGSVPAGVSSFLSSLFPTTSNYCTGTACDGDTADGGFGLFFGGPAAIATNTELSVATLLSGGTYTTAKQTDQHPTIDAAKTFYTTLSMGSPFQNISIDGGGDHTICDLRGALAGVEYTGVYDDAALTRFRQNGDVLSAASGGYQGTPVASDPMCTSFNEADQPTNDGIAGFIGSSLSDHFSATQVFNFGAAHRLTTTGAEVPESGAANPVSAGPTARDANHASELSSTTTPKSTQGTFAIGAFTIVVGPNSYAATASVTVNLTRPKNCTDDDLDANPCTFTGTFTITTSSGTITGNLAGEAITLDGSTTPVDTWRLTGMYTITGGTLSGVAAGAKGGFVTDWDTQATDPNADDTLVGTDWDGLAN